MNQIICRIIAVLDAVLSRWPNAWGGHFLRRACWSRRFLNCGTGVRFDEDLIILGFSNIRLGEHSAIMSRSYLYAHNGGVLSVGSYCSFNHNVQLAASGGEIEIGDSVLIGPNTVLRAADHEFENPDILIRKQGHRRGKIVVGDNVWLAANVVVTANVSIGDGCIVGAGAVVTHDLPAMTICVGNPAKPIRSRRSLPGAVMPEWRG